MKTAPVLVLEVSSVSKPSMFRPSVESIKLFILLPTVPPTVKLGTREHAFRSMKTIAECLADEIINTEKGDSQKSFAIRKKEEIEKVAKGNR